MSTENTEISVLISVVLNRASEEKVRGLVSQQGQPLDPLSEQYARAAIALILGAAEIRSISLSPHPEIQAGSGQNTQSAPLHQWTLDHSRPSFIFWNDGVSLEVPPRPLRDMAYSPSVSRRFPSEDSSN